MCTNITQTTMSRREQTQYDLVLSADDHRINLRYRYDTWIPTVLNLLGSSLDMLLQKGYNTSNRGLENENGNLDDPPISRSFSWTDSI
jgi:hypothetical protein